MTSANSVDGLATMTSAVTSSKSAVGSRHSAKKRWSQQEATVHQQMIFEKNQSASIRTTTHFFTFTPLAFQSLRKWYRKKHLSEGNPSPLALLPSELPIAGNWKKYATMNRLQKQILYQLGRMKVAADALLGSLSYG
ncbi:hypothetical protein F511_30773 [Dorcoceras hygrometricum]|uniref:Uncharacterized protein n=1 Tax=Dorcoceras hygrometricum TaxID=472368 RepID=A0A2Z7C034_9LAMI|nr:hypothetical protein F511_30773 [Dorcoceras hygrometricum]